MKPRQSTSRLSQRLAFLFLGLSIALAAWAQSDDNRRKLAQPAETQGYPCDRGYAFFYPNGKLKKCTVTHEIPFGEITIPAGSWITLSQEGMPWEVQTPHDIQILGLTSLGGGLLGPSEGSIIALYPTGKLKLCYLAHDQLVHGVPCAHGGVLNSLSGPDPGVHFAPDGKLRQCRLSSDYQGHRSGELFIAGR